MRIESRLAVILLAAALGSAQKPKDQSYSIVAGTVFRENGFALGGANVALRLKDPGSLRKFKPITTVSDGRGEFAFRVAGANVVYVVRASLKGFQPAEKEAAIGGPGERNEVSLVLVEESRNAPGESK
jgi:hypothetical protein